jgi:hypothetical protein
MFQEALYFKNYIYNFQITFEKGLDVANDVPYEHAKFFMFLWSHKIIKSDRFIF